MDTHATPRITSFQPEFQGSPSALVLGSIPGTASLNAGEYYAHPRNSFWQIAAEWCCFDPLLPYSERLQRINRCGIALWDVIASCNRTGSLDSKIKNPQPNPIDRFLNHNPGIKAILLNGRTAEKMFHRYFGKFPGRTTAVISLPSTSPAFASLNYRQKRDAWHKAFHAAGVLRIENC